MIARKRPAQSEPSVLDIGRQIVRLSNQNQDMECERSQLRRQGLAEHVNYRRDNDLARLIRLSSDREESLVDTALGMRAQTLGDVAVMLRLAWRVLDIEANSEPEGDSLERAFKQITHALLTSIDVVSKAAGLDLEETLGHDVQTFIDREHADLGSVVPTIVSVEPPVTEDAEPSRVTRLLLDLATDMGILDRVVWPDGCVKR